MIAKYKKKLEEAQAQLAVPMKGKQYTLATCPKALTKLITEAVNEVGWRISKFFPQTAEYQRAYVRAVLLKVLPEQYSGWPEEWEELEIFLGSVHTIVANKLNV